MAPAHKRLLALGALMLFLLILNEISIPHHDATTADTSATEHDPAARDSARPAHPINGTESLRLDKRADPSKAMDTAIASLNAVGSIAGTIPNTLVAGIGGIADAFRGQQHTAPAASSSVVASAVTINPTPPSTSTATAQDQPTPSSGSSAGNQEGSVAAGKSGASLSDAGSDSVQDYDAGSGGDDISEDDTADDSAKPLDGVRNKALAPAGDSEEGGAVNTENASETSSSEVAGDGAPEDADAGTSDESVTPKPKKQVTSNSDEEVTGSADESTTAEAEDADTTGGTTLVERTTEDVSGPTADRGAINGGAVSGRAEDDQPLHLHRRRSAVLGAVAAPLLGTFSAGGGQQSASTSPSMITSTTTAPPTPTVALTPPATPASTDTTSPGEGIANTPGITRKQRVKDANGAAANDAPSQSVEDNTAGASGGSGISDDESSGEAGKSVNDKPAQTSVSESDGAAADASEGDASSGDPDRNGAGAGADSAYEPVAMKDKRPVDSEDAETSSSTASASVEGTDETAIGGSDGSASSDTSGIAADESTEPVPSRPRKNVKMGGKATADQAQPTTQDEEMSNRLKPRTADAAVPSTLITATRLGARSAQTTHAVQTWPSSRGSSNGISGPPPISITTAGGLMGGANLPSPTPRSTVTSIIVDWTPGQAGNALEDMNERYPAQDTHTVVVTLTTTTRLAARSAQATEIPQSPTGSSDNASASPPTSITAATTPTEGLDCRDLTSQSTTTFAFVTWLPGQAGDALEAMAEPYPAERLATIAMTAPPAPTATGHESDSPVSNPASAGTSTMLNANATAATTEAEPSTSYKNDVSHHRRKTRAIDTDAALYRRSDADSRNVAAIPEPQGTDPPIPAPTEPAERQLGRGQRARERWDRAMRRILPFARSREQNRPGEAQNSRPNIVANPPEGSAAGASRSADESSNANPPPYERGHDRQHQRLGLDYSPTGSEEAAPAYRQRAGSGERYEGGVRYDASLGSASTVAVNDQDPDIPVARTGSGSGQGPAPGATEWSSSVETLAYGHQDQHAGSRPEQGNVSQGESSSGQPSQQSRAGEPSPQVPRRPQKRALQQDRHLAEQPSKTIKRELVRRSTPGKPGDRPIVDNRAGEGEPSPAAPIPTIGSSGATPVSAGTLPQQSPPAPLESEGFRRMAERIASPFRSSTQRGRNSNAPVPQPENEDYENQGPAADEGQNDPFASGDRMTPSVDTRWNLEQARRGQYMEDDREPWITSALEDNSNGNSAQPQEAPQDRPPLPYTESGSTLDEASRIEDMNAAEARARQDQNAATGAAQASGDHSPSPRSSQFAGSSITAVSNRESRVSGLSNWQTESRRPSGAGLQQDRSSTGQRNDPNDPQIESSTAARQRASYGGSTSGPSSRPQKRNLPDDHYSSEQDLKLVRRLDARDIDKSFFGAREEEYVSHDAPEAGPHEAHELEKRAGGLRKTLKSLGNRRSRERGQGSSSGQDPAEPEAGPSSQAESGTEPVAEAEQVLPEAGSSNLALRPGRAPANPGPRSGDLALLAENRASRRVAVDEAYGTGQVGGASAAPAAPAYRTGGTVDSPWGPLESYDDYQVDPATREGHPSYRGTVEPFKNKDVAERVDPASWMRHGAVRRPMDETVPYERDPHQQGQGRPAPLSDKDLQDKSLYLPDGKTLDDDAARKNIRESIGGGYGAPVGDLRFLTQGQIDQSEKEIKKKIDLYNARVDDVNRAKARHESSHGSLSGFSHRSGSPIPDDPIEHTAEPWDDDLIGSHGGSRRHSAARSRGGSDSGDSQSQAGPSRAGTPGPNKLTNAFGLDGTLLAELEELENQGGGSEVQAGKSPYQGQTGHRDGRRYGSGFRGRSRGSLSSLTLDPHGKPVPKSTKKPDAESERPDAGGEQLGAKGKQPERGL